MLFKKKNKEKEQRPWITWSKQQTQWLSKHPVFLFYQPSEANTPQEAAIVKTSGTACVWLQLYSAVVNGEKQEKCELMDLLFKRRM